MASHQANGQLTFGSATIKISRYTNYQALTRQYHDSKAIDVHREPRPYAKRAHILWHTESRGLQRCSDTRSREYCLQDYTRNISNSISLVNTLTSLPNKNGAFGPRICLIEYRV
ncbi:hypothetical protein BC629DRAFT_62392 [Irpex lacteus]|nr:hypothetical protein BC629DRAFT_62392 [Irpex lacteus]